MGNGPVVMLLLNDFTMDQRVHREATALCAAGYEVTILCLRSPGLPGEEVPDGVRVLRVADYSTVSYRRPDRMLRQRLARSRALRDAAVGLRPWVVHCHDTETLSAGAAAARRTGARLVYDAHELFPDSLIDHGLRGSWPSRALWRLTEHLLVPRSDAVITVSAGIAEVLRRRYGVHPTVVTNVPPLAPLGDRARLRRELGVRDDQVVLLYQGVLMTGRVVLPLVDVVGRLPRLVLAVQGWGPLEEALRRRARELGVSERVFLMGKKAPEELHGYACGADIGSTLLDPHKLNHRLARPNKLFAYLMAGVPVLATDLPEIAAVVAEEEVGVLVSDHSAEGLTRGLAGLVDDPERRAAMGRRARRAAERRYNWEHEQQALLQVYQGLV